MTDRPEPPLPLSDWRILVTRPAHQAQGLVAGIRRRGGEALVFPTIAIGSPGDLGPWQEVAGELEAFNWLVFVSANAVTGFAERLRGCGRSWPERPGYAAIGRKTAEALEAHGVREVTVPGDFRSEGLLALPQMASDRIAGQRVLLARGEGGRELLPTTLEERGAEVVRVPVYTRHRPQLDPAPVREALETAALDAAVFTSPATFTNLLHFLRDPDQKALSGVPLVAISPVTAEAVTQSGFPAPVVASEASEEGLFRTLEGMALPKGGFAADRKEY